MPTDDGHPVSIFQPCLLRPEIPTDSRNLHKVYIQEHYSKIVPEFVNLIVDPLAIFTSETLGHSKVLFLCPAMLLTCCKLTN